MGEKASLNEMSSCLNSSCPQSVKKVRGAGASRPLLGVGRAHKPLRRSVSSKHSEHRRCKMCDFYR